MIRATFKIVLLSFLGLLIMSCSGSNKMNYNTIFEGVDTEENDVLELVHMDDHFSTFAKLIDLADMEWDVFFNQNLTLFLPTNKAFDGMEVGEVERLLDPQNKAELQQFVQRHFLPREVPIQEFDQTQVIETTGEDTVPVNTGMMEGDVTIGGAQVVGSNIEASNGIIHIVNAVVKSTKDALP